MGVIGESEVGNRPWLSRNESGAVVYEDLRYMRERAKIERAQKVRIIGKWTVRRASKARLTVRSSPGGLATSRLRGPAAKDADGRAGPEYHHGHICHVHTDQS